MMSPSCFFEIKIILCSKSDDITGFDGIHEHCTAAEILVFGRETGFPTQTLQRWYMYKSHQEMETNLIGFLKLLFSFDLRKSL